MTTERMKKAVNFIADTIDVDFEGDIDNFNEVSAFLGKYLERAKNSPYRQYLYDEWEYWQYED